MTTQGLVQLLMYVVVLLALVKPLGWFMARVYEGLPGRAPAGLGPLLGWLERLIYAVCGVKREADGEPEQMSWRTYAAGILVFNALGFLAVYALQRLQGSLPGNPAGLGE